MSKQLTIAGKSRTNLLNHYHYNKFDMLAITKIKNSKQSMIKPYGGLWSSPADTEYGWYDWMLWEMPDWIKTKARHKTILELDTSADIYVIDTYEDLANIATSKEQYLDLPEFISTHIDFEELAKKYQILWLTAEGQYNTRVSRPFNLYGWDCETTLILDKSVVSVKDIIGECENV